MDHAPGQGWEKQGSVQPRRSNPAHSPRSRAKMASISNGIYRVDNFMNAIVPCLYRVAPSIP